MIRCVPLFIIFYCFTKCINCQQLFYKNTYIYAVHREDSLGFNDLSKTEGLDFRTDVVVNGVEKTVNGGDTVGEEGSDINGKDKDNIGRDVGAGNGKELIFNARRRVSMDTERRGGYIRKRDADEDEEEDGGGGDDNEQLEEEEGEGEEPLEGEEGEEQLEDYVQVVVANYGGSDVELEGFEDEEEEIGGDLKAPMDVKIMDKIDGKDKGGEDGKDKGGEDGKDKGGKDGKDKGGEDGKGKGGKDGKGKGGKGGKGKGAKGKGGKGKGGKGGKGKGVKGGADEDEEVKPTPPPKKKCLILRILDFFKNLIINIIKLPITLFKKVFGKKKGKDVKETVDNKVRSLSAEQIDDQYLSGRNVFSSFLDRYKEYFPEEEDGWNQGSQPRMHRASGAHRRLVRESGRPEGKLHLTKQEDLKNLDGNTWLGRLMGKQNEYRKRHIAK